MGKYINQFFTLNTAPNIFERWVQAFHKAMNQPWYKVPQFPEEERIAKRKEWIREEWNETCVAVNSRDIVQVADGLADLLYVTFGMAGEFGIPLSAVFELVQKANMAKLGPDGKPTLVNGKVQKPEGWKPPDNDIARILQEAGYVFQPDECEKYDLRFADNVVP